MSKRGSKRKPELDLEAERSSYASFVAAANAVSQLYTAGVREQRRTAKNTLVSAALHLMHRLLCVACSVLWVKNTWSMGMY